MTAASAGDTRRHSVTDDKFSILPRLARDGMEGNMGRIVGRVAAVAVCGLVGVGPVWGASATRTASFAYDSATGLLTQEVVFGGFGRSIAEAIVRMSRPTIEDWGMNTPRMRATTLIEMLEIHKT